MAIYVAGIVISLVLLYITTIFLGGRKSVAPLPPGPPRKPIIGNLRDVPPEGKREWQHWLKHKDIYGPLSSLEIFGQVFVIVNESRLAFEIMEKRSAVASSRPAMTFNNEMVGWNRQMGVLPYNDRFRAYKKAIHRHLGSNVAAPRYHPTQEVEVRRFLLRVLEKPGDLLQHLRKEAGAAILKVAYGYTIEPHEPDPLVDLIDAVMDEFSHSPPGRFLVDFFPWLRYLPDWFPGTGFKQVARKWRKTLTVVAEMPFSFVQQQMAKSSFERSFLSSLLEKNPEPGSMEETVCKWSAASLYAAGADTTVSSMACFFLAMSLFPEVQRKAQQELDQVIGTGRLPGFEDRIHLPYIDAMVKEVLRWQPVVPMGLPHVMDEDITCDGYLIPKGAMVMPNIWGFFHNPDVYHEPMAFKPERFLDHDGYASEPDPHDIAFGFGRRACPGRLMADSTLYLSVAQSVAVFDIGKAMQGGKEINHFHQGLFRPGLLCHPFPFDVSIKPRTPEHEKLIRSVEVEHPWEKSHADELGVVENE